MSKENIKDLLYCIRAEAYECIAALDRSQSHMDSRREKAHEELQIHWKNLKILLEDTEETLVIGGCLNIKNSRNKK